MKHRAFTLIELLIVVAIIGILAAIAVPNFLNARIRANVARAYSDIRALDNAYGMYQIDNTAYPYFGGNLWYTTVVYPKLTSPIAYMNSIPLDPWPMNENLSWKFYHEDYYPCWNIYWVRKSGDMWGGYEVTKAVEQGSYMLTISAGPDKIEEIGLTTATGGLYPYHTSNGLVSRGDIYRFTPGQQAGSF